MSTENKNTSNETPVTDEQTTANQDNVSPEITQPVETDNTAEIMLKLDDTLDFLNSRVDAMNKALAKQADSASQKASKVKERVEQKLKTDFMRAMQSLDDEIKLVADVEVDEDNASLKSMVEGIGMIYKGALQSANVETIAEALDTGNAETNGATDGSAAEPAKKAKAKSRARSILQNAQDTMDPFAKVEGVLQRAQDAIELASLQNADENEYFTSMQERLEEALGNVEKLNGNYNRLQSRTADEVTKAEKYGAEKLTKKFVEVVDNIDRAMQVAESCGEDLSEETQLGRLYTGVKETKSKLIIAFEQNGVQRDDPKGDKLNPHRHQAVQAMPVADTEKDTVVNVMAAGYMLHDRVVRPAMVIVAS